jgi:hypothetical protein
MSVYTTRVDELWGHSKVMTAPNVTRHDPVYKQAELRYPTMAEPVKVKQVLPYNPAPMLTMASAPMTMASAPGDELAYPALPCLFAKNHWIIWLGLAFVIVLFGLCWHLKTRVDGLEMMVQYLMFHSQKRL